MKYFNDFKRLKILSELGLSEKEALIYLAALDLGGGSITQLAEFCHIERTGIYYHIQRLIDLKLIKTVELGKRTIYLPSDPERLKSIFSEKQKNFDQIFPQMQEQFSRDASKSIVRYFEGKEETGQFYGQVYDLLKSLPEEANTVYNLGSSYNIVVGTDPEFEIFEKPVEQLRIKMKSILPLSQKIDRPKGLEGHPYIVTRYNLPPAEIKYISDRYRYPGSLNITQNHVIMYDWRNLIFSITENKNNAATWRMFFELTWDNLPVKNRRY